MCVSMCVLGRQEQLVTSADERQSTYSTCLPFLCLPTAIYRYLLHTSIYPSIYLLPFSFLSLRCVGVFSSVIQNRLPHALWASNTQGEISTHETIIERDKKMVGGMEGQRKAGGRERMWGREKS